MEQQTNENAPKGAASELNDGLEVLLPCPFCGKTSTLGVITGAELMDEDQEYWQHSDSYGVVCDAATPNGKGGCGATGGFCDTKSAAVALWNSRTSNANSTTS